MMISCKQPRAEALTEVNDDENFIRFRHARSHAARGRFPLDGADDGTQHVPASHGALAGTSRSRKRLLFAHGTVSSIELGENVFAQPFGLPYAA